MTELTLSAPAKLNLFLHITAGPEPASQQTTEHSPSFSQEIKGYHQLETVFQLIDVGDTLHFRKTNTPGIRVHCPKLDTPEADNLVTRAAHALLAYSCSDQRVATPNTASQGVAITVTKHLPTGAGIGGGSSDAATTLLGLNALWDLQLDLETLAVIGRSLGADVPVFIHGHTAHATGIGDQLTACHQPTLWFVLIKPHISISTAALFQHPDLSRNTPPLNLQKPLRLKKTMGLQKTLSFEQHSTWWSQTRNDFEPLARQMHPEINAILEHLSVFSHARLTGTGSTCFAAFDSQTAAQQALSALEKLPEIQRCWRQLARGINRSPVHEALFHNSVSRKSFLK